MSEINRKRFAYPPITLAPIIFRLGSHTYIVHAALENENPTEQRQVIVNRVRLYRNNAPEVEDNHDDFENDFFSNLLFDEDEENVAIQREHELVQDDQDHQDIIDHQENEHDDQNLNENNQDQEVNQDDNVMDDTTTERARKIW